MGPFPKMSRSKMSLRLACGSVEKHRTLRFRFDAMKWLRPAEHVVLPSPPFPAKMTIPESPRFSKYVARPTGRPQKTWSVKSRSRNTRCFQLLMFGTAYGRILSE